MSTDFPADHRNGIIGRCNVGHEPFETTEREWKFRNVDFFHLLQAIVWQQDERLIPALRRARDFYAIPGARPEDGESVEAVVCQIAIGRIRKRHADGYLPTEALELAMPSAAIMASFTGREYDAKAAFKEMYGEYFTRDMR